MANILLTVNNDSRAVSKTRNFAGVQLENLEDAFIVKFADEFINGDGSLEYEVDGNPYFLPMTKDVTNELYSIDITQALITEEGTYPFQVRVTQGDKIFKSQIFYLKIYPSINAVDAPPPMPNWQQWVIEYVDEHSGKIDSISVNGTVQPIDENKNVDIDVPTETSRLTNDGDGTSPYATEDYVSEYGGKIDKIQKNGTDLPINNKTVNIPVPTAVAELTDASDYATVSEVNTALENVGNAIQNVDNKLQSGASSEDPCTTESFVNSSINAIAAFYITKNAAGDPFATKAELDSTSVYYSGGQVRVPTRNDYCLVVADITKAKVVENYSTFTLTAQYVGYHIIYNNIDTLVTDENKDTVGITPGTTPCYYSIPTTRYTYQNNQWEYQYIINDTSLTARQIAAINSGITAALVAQIGTNQSNLASHIANTSNPHNVTKTQVGLGNVDNTSDINKPVSAAQQSALDGKIDKPVVAGTNGQILTSNGQGGSSWEDPVEAPIQSIILEGEQSALVPDANGQVTIPTEEPDTLEVAEATATPIVTSISNASTDNQIPTAKAVNDRVNGAVEDTLAPAYDNTQTYAEGNVVTYLGKLYICNSVINPAEDFNPSHWDETTELDLLEDLDNRKANVSALADKADLTDIAPAYDSTSTYAVGDIVSYDGDIYKCNTTISVAEAWDSTHWTRKRVDELISENVPDLSNYVTLNTAQTITNGKEFTSTITSRGGDVYGGIYIGTSGSSLNSKSALNLYNENGYIRMRSANGWTKVFYQPSSNDHSLHISAPYSGYNIYLENNTAPSSDDTKYLGTSSYRWKYLYLAGDLSDGTNSISIANISNKNSIATTYDATSTYNIGDKVLYQGYLYQCNTDITTAEAWDSTHWTQTTIDDVKQDTLTTSSVVDGTIDKVIGFDSSNNLVKGAAAGGGLTSIWSGTQNISTTQVQLSASVSNGNNYLFIVGTATTNKTGIILRMSTTLRFALTLTNANNEIILCSVTKSGQYINITEEAVISGATITAGTYGFTIYEVYQIN